MYFLSSLVLYMYFLLIYEFYGTYEKCSLLHRFLSFLISSCLSSFLSVCGLQHPDDIYSNILGHAEPGGGGRQQEADRAVEDVSYVSVQFRHKSQARYCGCGRVFNVLQRQHHTSAKKIPTSHTWVKVPILC